MTVNALKIAQLRNLHELILEPHPQYNYFIGPNGSGKTSLLEAIHILGMGRSFRTKNNYKIIQYQHDNLHVFAHIANGNTIGILKNRNGTTHLKLNAEDVLQSSTLARTLPLQLFTSDSFQLIEAGAKARRQLLDWGVFHVKHNFLELNKQYRYALKQRNHLLRSNATPLLIASWNQPLACYAQQLHRLRQEYINELLPIFNAIYAKVSDLTIHIDYFKGWGTLDDNDAPLESTLEQYIDNDLKLKYTTQGAHAADITIKSEKYTVKDVLSRGQQKLILVILKIAQGILLTQALSGDCLYLFDDLCAEFDDANLALLSEILAQVPGQFFFTGVANKIYETLGDKNPGERFHVKQGQIDTLRT